MRLIRYCILLIISVLFGEGVAVSQTLDITTPFYQKIVSEGFDSLTVIDLSSESMIAIDEPRCAYVNITEIEAMPIEKNDDMHGLKMFKEDNSECTGQFFPGLCEEELCGGFLRR